MMDAVARLVEKLDGRAPKTAIVLGSGLGGLVDEVKDAVRVSYAALPGFPVSGVTGHAGEIVAGTFGGAPVLLLAGRAHYYEHGNAAAMRPVLETLAGIGIERLILTNAAGSLEADIPPGSIMLITDHINFSGSNPLIGEPTDRRFVGLTEAYDAGIRAAFETAAKATGTDLHIRMARVFGANAVGMSTVPEVILARFLGLRVAACSVITNYAAGMTGAELSHQETKDVAPQGGRKLAAVLKRIFEEGMLDG